MAVISKRTIGFCYGSNSKPTYRNDSLKFDQNAFILSPMRMDFIETKAAHKLNEFDFHGEACKVRASGLQGPTTGHGYLGPILRF
jgi:hypothetical protein